LEPAKLPAVHPVRALCGTLLLIAGAGAATAQAPASADMWRLSAATLAGPAALEEGASGAFWNPAAAWGSPRVRLGVQVLQTPDILGVTGLLAGVAYRWSDAIAGQLVLARTQVGDLVRTTTSPTSDLGSIPVYEQLVGVGAALRQGIVTGGALLRAHNARFDAERDNGVTLDLGVQIALPWASLAAATHFFPLDVGSREVTDYYAAAEAQPASPNLWGTPGRLFLRYGVSARRGSGVEHGGGVGLELDRRFRLDASLVAESGYGDREGRHREVSWRPAVGVLLRVGRYAITAARSSGLGGLGASYRIGLDVDALR
jgi:hypothetical protein